MNSVVLVGRIATDIKEGYVKDKKKYYTVLNFTVAVPRKNSKDETDFLRCSAWNGLADFIKEYFTKGQRIAIRGEIRIDTVEKKEGKLSYTNILVHEADFCEPKKDK